MNTLQKAFRRYQIMAWSTGVVLAVMTFVGLPWKYLLGNDSTWTEIGWQAHGAFFIFYLLATTDLGIKARWSVGKMLVTAIGGTVPLMSFFVEHRLRRDFQ